MGEHEEINLKMDSRIRYTVKTIISDFFSAFPLNILFMYYDEYDGKQFKRFICFDKWFKDFNSTSFYKEDTDLYVEELWMNKLSLLMKSDHPSFSLVLQEFHEIKNNLITEK